jgi:hypothetical protein
MKFLEPIHLYTIIIQVINIIFLDQIPTKLVRKKKKRIFYASINILNTLPLSLTILNSNTANFKTAFRKYLNTHPIYSAGEYVVCKDGLKYCFVKET